MKKLIDGIMQAKTPLTNLLNTSLQCKICYSLLSTPRLIICGHSFCQKCIKPRRETCPTCYSRTSFDDIFDFKMDEIIKAVNSKTNKENTDLLKLLNCDICCNPMDRPITSNCGHTQCSTCSNRCKVLYNYCPSCKTTMRSRFPNRNIDSLVKQFVIQSEYS